MKTEPLTDMLSRLVKLAASVGRGGLGARGRNNSTSSGGGSPSVRYAFIRRNRNNIFKTFILVFFNLLTLTIQNATNECFSKIGYSKNQELLQLVKYFISNISGSSTSKIL